MFRTLHDSSSSGHVPVCVDVSAADASCYVLEARDGVSGRTVIRASLLSTAGTRLAGANADADGLSMTVTTGAIGGKLALHSPSSKNVPTLVPEHLDDDVSMFVSPERGVPAGDVEPASHVGVQVILRCRPMLPREIDEGGQPILTCRRNEVWL